MSNCDMRNGRRIHECGKPREVMINRLTILNPFIAGEIVPISKKLYPCQEAQFEEAKRVAEEVINRLENIFQ